MKQYKLLGGHEEIAGAIAELEMAKIILQANSPYDSPVWPVQKSDGTWCRMMDFWELHKVTCCCALG
jgi:hypothetical protein